MFAALLWFIAAICALAAVSSAANAEFQPIRTTIDTLLVPAPANLAYAVFLGTLAAAVLRRKRLAYWVLVVYFILSLIVGVLTGLLLVTVGADRLTDDTGRRLFTLIETVGVWVGIGFAAAALALLLAARREFYARVRSGSTRRALGVFFGLAAAAVGLGYLLLTAVPGSLRSWLDRVGYAIEKVFGGAITLDVTRHGHAPGWVNLLLGGMGAVAFLAGLFTLLRSQRAAAVLHPDEEQRIRALLARYGDRDSLGYFATRRDKAAIFSPSGKAARHLPGGQRRESGQRRPGRRPGGVGAGDRRLAGRGPRVRLDPGGDGGERGGRRPPTRRAGLKVLQLGDEAILRGAGSSTWTAGTCGRSGRRCTGSSGPATPRRSAGTPTSPPTSWPTLADAGRRAGGTPRTSAASRWRWAGSATRPTGDCVLVEALRRRRPGAGAAVVRARGAPTGCRWT